MNCNIADGIQTIIKALTKDNISFDGKDVLVAGGAGFLGSWLCDVLVSQGATVISIDNYSTGQKQTITHLIGMNPQFTQIECDVCNTTSTEFPDSIDFDFIFHFASPAAPPYFQTHPTEIFQANTVGTFQLLELARKYDAKIIFASSSEIYGNPIPKGPISESYNGNVNPIGVRGCYDEAKRAGEALIKAFERQYGIQGVILRIFNTYGPRIEKGRAVPNFILANLRGEPFTIFGDGSQTRSFTYVTDEIMGILKAAALSNTNGEVMNLGSDKEVTIQELAELISSLSGGSYDYTYESLPEDDPVRRCADIEKARNLLGWEPQIALAEGLKRTIEWFQNTEVGED